MTGRKQRLVRDPAGNVIAEKRNAGTGVSMEALNLKEREAFMAGTKRVAIISEAASSGISLQADRRCASAHMQRVHITLELPWSSARLSLAPNRRHCLRQLVCMPALAEAVFPTAQLDLAAAAQPLQQGVQAQTMGPKRTRV